MRRFLSILFVALTMGILRADDPPAPQPRPMGIIILKAVAGYPEADSWFVSIAWSDKDSGYVVDTAGKKLAFINDGIGRIIYFDAPYYAEIDHNQYWIDWRAVVKSREVVLAPVPALRLDHGDISQLTDEQATLEDAISRYHNGAELVQPLIDTLKDEITKLNSGLVLENGAWVSQKEVASVVVPVVGDSDAPITFTTTDGKRFENAKVTVTNTGLSVLTSDGGSSVSFDRLPDDLSPFPRGVREKIADWRARNQDIAAASSSSSSGWWQWVKDTWTFVAGKVSGYFSSSPPPPPADSTTNAAPAH